jgi:hypothetical protein
MNLLQCSGTQKHILSESLNHRDARGCHANFIKTVRIKVHRKIFQWVGGRVGCFMDRAGKVFKKPSYSHSKVEVKQINVVLFRDVMDVMVLKAHGKI